MRDLKDLPKAHLHLHLDGSLRESTLNELCEQLGLEHPPLPKGSYESFGAFMDTIAACHDALSSPDSLRRIVYEVIDDAAADGAVWVEISLWPGLFGGRLGPDRRAVQLVLDAGREAATGSGVGFGVMVAANRHEGPAAAIATATLAVELRSEGVVSFGLDGDEAAFPPSPFAEAFEIAKVGRLLCTPHAGELLGPRSVAAALDLLQADRILHGVRAIEDEELLTQLASSQVCLDVCPTSNAKLSVFTLEDHPLPVLLDRGIRCTVNADDPLLFGTTLGQEYEICRTQFSLSDEDLATIATCSIESSGAPSELKRAAVGEVGRWLGSHHEQ
jgi:adenosine deaminase